MEDQENLNATHYKSGFDWGWKCGYKWGFDWGWDYGFLLVFIFFSFLVSNS